MTALTKLSVLSNSLSFPQLDDATVNPFQISVAL